MWHYVFTSKVVNSGGVSAWPTAERFRHTHWRRKRRLSSATQTQIPIIIRRSVAYNFYLPANFSLSIDPFFSPVSSTPSLKAVFMSFPVPSPFWTSVSRAIVCSPCTHVEDWQSESRPGEAGREARRQIEAKFVFLTVEWSKAYTDIRNGNHEIVLILSQNLLIVYRQKRQKLKLFSYI